MTRDQASALIEYLEALEERVDHQRIMERVAEFGLTEKELDEAAIALGTLAGRTYSIL
jgi:hypothetical protein